MNEIVYALQDVFEATFKILPLLGNIPNYLFIAIGFVGLYVWLKMQKGFDDKAEKTGTLK